jgi:hypothetical protein
MCENYAHRHGEEHSTPKPGKVNSWYKNTDLKVVDLEPKGDFAWLYLDFLKHALIRRSALA